MERENAWKKYSEEQLEELENLSDSYRKFLDKGKTERECVKEIVKQAEKAGYKDLAKLISKGKKLKSGDKVYAVNMKKSVVLFQIGKKPMEQGLNILGAHIDSPRLDVKQNPLYEDSDFAYLDTHYYGGIKKYQWVAMPLAIHGAVAKKDGSVVEVSIGEEDKDPVVCVTDLLIHLSGEQLEKKAAKVNRDDQILEERLSESIGAPVHVVYGRRGKGRLVIDFANFDDLDSLIERLAPGVKQEDRE